MQTAYLVSFLTIAETGSFSKAAQRLHMTQPTLTQQIQTLEKELGFKLFERDRKKGTQLTPAGKQLAPKLKKILKELDEAVLDARGQQPPVTVRISCIIYDAYILPMSLYEYVQENMPEVRLKLQIEEKDIVEPLRRGMAEMAIAGDCPDAGSEEFEFTLLGFTRYLCVMRPGHPLAQRSQITLEELMQYPVAFSVPDFSSSYNEHVREIRRKYPQLREMPNYTHILYPSVTSFDTIYLSVCSAKDFFKDMAQVPLAEDWEMPYGLMYPKDSGPAVRRVCELVQTFVKDHL